MGIFGNSVGFDADVEKATSETNTNENWTLILDVCDKTSQTSNNKDCLKAIMKRMGHYDPHVVMQAITLLDACVSNCGKPFHLEIASREFQTEFLRLLGKSQPKVAARMCQVLKSWAEGEFSSDRELNLIPSLYEKLRQENHDFGSAIDKPSKSSKTVAAAKNPNAKQEEDDLAKAIELSLKEVKNSPKLAAPTTSSSSSQYPSLYPSVAATSSTNSAVTVNNQPEPRKVRALYDFEAAEENELTFVAGDIIHVTDDSDPNWWKGYNQCSEGLFPSNFVTSDLSIDPERLEINQQNKIKKSTQFEEDTKELQHKTEAAAVAAAAQQIDIDEQKIDRLLHLLNEANPEDPSQDTEEMLRLEQEVHQMGPLIDAELERVDRKHAQLSQLSSDLVDAINLYHSLMRDDRNFSASSYQMPGPMQGMTGAPMFPGMPHMMYGSGAGYQTNFGPQSLQSSLPSMPYSGPSGSFPTQMGMSMQYSNGLSNGQHQLQGLSPHTNNQSLPNQQLSHPQHMFLPPPHVLASNVGPNGESLQQHPTQHQSFPVMALGQQYGPPISPSVGVNVLQTNQTQTGQNQPQQFMSPQHCSEQQTQANDPSLPNPPHHTQQNGHVSYMANQQQQQVHNSPSTMPSGNTMEQFGQLQQQMNNMSIANQPYTTNMQHNIPIYQQQR